MEQVRKAGRTGSLGGMYHNRVDVHRHKSLGSSRLGLCDESVEHSEAGKLKSTSEHLCDDRVTKLFCMIFDTPNINASSCGNIRYFWLVSEESFWLCAYLDERDEVVQCASSAIWWGVHILLWRIQCWHSLRKQFGIRDSGHRKNARVRLHQLARPIDVVSS